MAPPTSTPRLFSTLCTTCRARIASKGRLPRQISTSTSLRATAPPKERSPLGKFVDSRPNPTTSALDDLSALSDKGYGRVQFRENSTPDQLTDETERRFQNTHRLCIYTTKHNTHLTLSTPAAKPMVSLSCGNLGFRKANRGTYEAAYQTTALSLKRIQERGFLGRVEALEVAFRGFGPGRDAVTKCLLGPEGRGFRGKIVRVVDATRVKFGGTRSPRPRRLG
ncbi:MAG: hypothetical protein M1828_002835 [Chrysothrix sp. TS-e1954]|nr:MAG: hypothetical protein M1828_002835 [Chrysothrix sp. TS-e1954]